MTKRGRVITDVMAVIGQMQSQSLEFDPLPLACIPVQ